MKLSTRNLKLRPFELSDRSSLVRMHKNERVRNLLIDDFPLDDFSYAGAFIERQQQIYQDMPGLGIWCAERQEVALKQHDMDRPEVRYLPDHLIAELTKQRSVFTGWFSLLPMPHDLQELELGSRLLPKYWGTGFALDGGELLINYAFNQLKYEQIWIVCHPEHRSVDFVAHVLGFSRDQVKEYNEQPAQYYVLHHQHWESWQTFSRKKRLKHGVQVLKSTRFVS